MEKKTKNTKTIIITIVAVLELIAIIWLAVYATQLKEEVKIITQKVEVLSSEKQNVEKDFENLLTDYESLETDNKEVKLKLEAEKERVKEVLAELKKTKAINRYKLKEYEKELEALRRIMRGFIKQIDSLNLENDSLVAENKKVKQKYTEVKTEREELAQAKEQLNEKVEQAAVLNARNIQIIGLNVKDKVTLKIDKLYKFKICFTIDENPVATKGEQFFYIRIAAPDGRILYTSDRDLFESGGKEIIFTSKRKIDYQGKDVNTCVYWKNNRELPEGKYVVDIFAGGQLIGTKNMTFK